ncbi:MAG: serine hydrolase [Chloroflexi bacterium]|nr:serine hydrolase [Chloroflexota bacterium]
MPTAPHAGAPPAPSIGQPLGNLAPDLVDLLADLPGEVSVAAIDLRRNLAFTHQGDIYFDLASVSKVPLMLAVLRECEREERALTPRERGLLEVMIHSSNNEAASALWDDVAGEVPSLLFDSEIWPDILLPRGWGLWTGTAQGVARVFQEIVSGESLSPDVRDDAMRLLDGVVHWQRWGVSAGLPDDGASVALKNGWYPQKAGWIVHSAGYVLDAGGRPDYVLVILSRYNPTLESGIALVEEIASGLHAALRPTVVSAGLRQPAR